MATSGTITGTTSNTYITARVVWTETATSATANTSTVTATLSYKKSSSSTASTYGTLSYSMTIGSNTVSGSTYVTLACNDTWVSIVSKTYTISHSSDGSKSISISATGSISGTSLTSTSLSGTATLTTLDRTAPTITISSTSTTSSSITVKATSNVSCNTWQYSINGGSSYTTFNSGSATSVSKTISGLSANTTYSLRIRAYKVANNISSYASKSVTTVGASSITSAAAVTMSDDGTACKVIFTPYSTAYYYTLSFSCGEQTVTTDRFCPGQTTAFTYTDYYFITSEWAPFITDSTSATCTVILTTYASSSTSSTIGTGSKTFTLSVPSDLMPTVSNVWIIEAEEDLPSAFIENWVQGISKQEITAVCEGAEGSTIESIAITANGVSTDVDLITVTVEPSFNLFDGTTDEWEEVETADSLAVLPYSVSGDDIAIEVGDYLTFSGWIDTSECTGTVSIYIKNSKDSIIINGGNIDAGQSEYYLQKTVSITSSRLSKIEGETLYVEIMTDNDETSIIGYRCIKLEIGAQATAWYPSESESSDTLTGIGATLTTETLTSYGGNSITVKATDSRGRSISRTLEFYVYQYYVPTISIGYTTNGTTLTVTATIGLAPVLGNNDATASFLAVASADSSDYYSGDVSINAYTDTQIYTAEYTVTIETLQTETFNITVTVEDQYTSVTATKTTGVICLSFYGSGTGAAFGKEADAEGLEVAWQNTTVQNLRVEAIGYIQNLSIDEAATIPDLTVTGTATFGGMTFPENALQVNDDGWKYIVIGDYMICWISYRCGDNVAVSTDHGDYLYRSDAITLPDYPIEYTAYPSVSYTLVGADSGYEKNCWVVAYTNHDDYAPKVGPGPVLLLSAISDTRGHPRISVIAFGAIDSNDEEEE